MDGASASIHSQFSGLERPYEESVGLGSYTDQKAVVWSKNEGKYSYQFYGRLCDKGWRFWKFSVCPMYFCTLRVLSGM